MVPDLELFTREPFQSIPQEHYVNLGLSGKHNITSLGPVFNEFLSIHFKSLKEVLESFTVSVHKNNSKNEKYYRDKFLNTRKDNCFCSESVTLPH